MGLEALHRSVDAASDWPVGVVIGGAFTLLYLSYAVFPHKRPSELLAACQRHTAHHTRWKGNYGFYLPRLDRWPGTRLPLDSYRLN